MSEIENERAGSKHRAVSERVNDAYTEGEQQVPPGMRLLDQWIVYRCKEVERNGKMKTKKVPTAPEYGERGRTFAIDPTSTEFATDFETATEFAETAPVDGIGFLLTPEDDIVGLDFDDCFDEETGTIREWAYDIINDVDSFTEISPSGTGLHVYTYGELDPGYMNKNSELGFEMYDEDRFFTVTGRSIEELSNGVCDAGRDLIGIQSLHFDAASVSSNDFGASVDIDDIDPVEPGEFGRVEERIVEKARSCDDQFDRLYQGDRGPSDSPSEADFAFCCKLAFWCKGDEQTMDAIFRDSGLYRPKWDAPRGNTTYGGLTIAEAKKANPDRYSGFW